MRPLFAANPIVSDLENRGRRLGVINNTDFTSVAANAEWKEANHEQYVVRDRNPHHCRCY
jgi:hypothetical protein